MTTPTAFSPLRTVVSQLSMFFLSQLSMFFLSQLSMFFLLQLSVFFLSHLLHSALSVLSITALNALNVVSITALSVLSICEADRETVERMTKGQRSNKHWATERMKWLQSSNFGQICK